MKILGIGPGRGMGSTEILIKEAFMGAEEFGAEVELIHLFDLSIKHCMGCSIRVVHSEGSFFCCTGSSPNLET